MPKYFDCDTNTSVSTSDKSNSLESWVYPTAFSTNFCDNVIANKLSTTTHGYNLRCGGNDFMDFNVFNILCNI